MRLLIDKKGWTFAVVSGDSHATKWCEEQQRLDYDRSVDDVLKFIKSGDVVVDAGAFIGAFTVPMAKAVGVNGMVLAFEANLSSYCCLVVNCREHNNVSERLLALGDSDTVMSVKRWDDQPENAGASYLISEFNESRVRVTALDNFNLDRCDFIKIDVEGFEPRVIRGAMMTIKKYRPKIFVELNDVALARNGFTKQDVLKPLLEIGYNVKFLQEKHNLLMPQLDVFLFPN